MNTTADALRTASEASWSPYSESAVVSVSSGATFKKANVEERSVVMTVEKNKIDFTPLDATPAVLGISNESGEACASYNFGINGVDTYSGAESNPWWGVGANCRDFRDRGMLDEWSGRTDKSNQTTGAFETRCGSAPSTVYGVEWPETQQRHGEVFLKTIFYTPRGYPSTANIVLATDSAAFYGTGQESTSSLGLSGTQIEGFAPMESVQNILDNVRERNICVQGEGLKQRFYWNASKPMREIESLEKELADKCIR